MLKTLLIGGGVALIPVVLTIIASREKTNKWGVNIGVMLSKIFQQKLGEKAENALESTLGDFLEGIIEGMNKDDKK